MVPNAFIRIRKISSLLLAVIFATSLPFSTVQAADFSPFGISISDTTAKQTGVTYTPNFTTATTSLVQEIDFDFSTTSGGSTRPAGMGLSGTSLGATTGLDNAWVMDLTHYSTGLIKLTHTGGATSIPSGTAITVALPNITNPAIRDCDAGSTTLTDTCYLRVTTYSDLGSTTVDSSNIGFTLSEDPYMVFKVEAVSSGTTTDGITSTLSSTPTTIDGGTLLQDTPQYLTQKITVTTNAPNGYSVYAYLENPLTSDNSSSIFSPFGATNATWSTPQLWTDPTGSVANSNSGWIGANISDTGVTGWSTTSQLFGPISTTPREITNSAGAQPTGKVTYITYGLEVNKLQPSDRYTGIINYRVEARY